VLCPVVDSSVQPLALALGAWLWVPLLSQAQPRPSPPLKPLGPTPTPVPLVKPIALQAPGGSGVAFFLEFPTPSEGGLRPISLAGESTDAAHPNTVELLSASLGIRMPTPTASSPGGAAAGKAEFQALRVIKNVDLASPGLFFAAGQGAQFPLVNLYVRRSGGDDTTPLYQFKQVHVTRSVVAADSSVDQPQETVEFVFGAMRISYASQPAVTAAWSTVLNQATFEVGP
jgi:type VI secretion system secreted protein Hcp